MSSLREKRDVQDDVNDALDEVKNAIKGHLGVGDTCGAGGVIVVDKCNAISYCKCGEGVLALCTCALSWWFILIIVVAALAIIGAVVCCVKKALCCCCGG